MSHETVAKFLSYEPHTGHLRWRVQRRDLPVGAAAGYAAADGTIHVTLAGIQCCGHDLAWQLIHGVWPPRMLEHVNGNRSDNRIENLRMR